MSADLFAEFNDLSQSPPQSQPQQPVPFTASASAHQTRGPAAHSWEYFGSSNGPPLTSQPTTPWASLQAQSSGGSGCLAAAPPLSQPLTVPDDDDGWGDFEVAEPSQFSAAPTASNQGTWRAQAPAPAPAPVYGVSSEPQPRARIVRASTMDLMTNNLVDTGNLPSPSKDSSWAQPAKVRPKMKTIPSDPNVMFDVDDFELQAGGPDDADDDNEEDDEFGDFETVAPAPRQPKPAPVWSSNAAASLDLLSIDDSLQSTPQPHTQVQPPSQLLGNLSFGSSSLNYPKAPKSPSYQERNPFPDLEVRTPTAAEASKWQIVKSSSPVTAWPSADVGPKPDEPTKEEDEWAAWDDGPAVESNNKKVSAEVIEPADNWDWDATENANPTSPSLNKSIPPPVNVPPPSVILSAFPDLLSSGNSLFKPMSGQISSIKQRVLADPKVVDFLHGYILLATTAARVIAGRKHRWHRDKILAKSMSISAAGSKGMKLAGVDKTQSVREDREAADVVGVWREHVGRLRSAVVAANAAGKIKVKVPELSNNLLVHTAKMVPTAAKACVICGLKREERITKVDYDVEDSFGEWWVDHWGHKVCKNFWIEHEQRLRQR